MSQTWIKMSSVIQIMLCDINEYFNIYLSRDIDVLSHDTCVLYSVNKLFIHWLPGQY